MHPGLRLGWRSYRIIFNMRLWLFLIPIWAGNFSGVWAQEADEPLCVVPLGVKQLFQEVHPGAQEVYWEVWKDGFRASFFENGLSREIQFAETGQWVCVNTYVELSELPQAVRDFLNRRYPHMEMPSVLCRVETPARGVLYRVNLDLPHGLLELTLDVGGKLLDERLETYQN